MSLYPDDAELVGEDNDPSKSVDTLLAKEMFALDMKERTALQEEVHGIQSSFFDETPEIKAKALSDLAEGIERIPAEEKTMYLRSLEIPGSYIQTRSFRLRILRATAFHIGMASRKVVEFCNVVVDLFGEIGLKRPIRLSDFSKKDLQLFRLGRYQFLPFGDRLGRRILAIIPDEVWESIPPKSKARLSFYSSWISATDDESQRKGIVVLVWLDKEFKVSPKPKVQIVEHRTHTVRAAAIHLCMPDTPLFRFRGAVLTMRLGRARRSLQIHIGNSMENRYSLQSFGIGGDQIPVSYTGKIKLGYIRQLIGVRRIIEDSMYSPETIPTVEALIEFPKPEDVVFRQGSSCSQHAANYAFRNLIVSKVQEQELSRDIPGVKIRRKKMVLDIVDEVQANGRGRFLIWNDNGGWNELTDEEVIHSKIEYLIKEFRKSVRVKLKKRPQVILSADTSMFKSNYEQPTRPLDLDHEIDEKQLVEAACCVVNCFSMQQQKPSSFDM